ncbi:MAG: hypothetical protein WDO56_09215 [Gammaproteobacteria bacterium]
MYIFVLNSACALMAGLVRCGRLGSRDASVFNADAIVGEGHDLAIALLDAVEVLICGVDELLPRDTVAGRCRLVPKRVRVLERIERAMDGARLPHNQRLELADAPAALFQNARQAAP